MDKKEQTKSSEQSSDTQCTRKKTSSEGEPVSSETGEEGGGKFSATLRKTLTGTQTLLKGRANEGLLPFLHNIAEAGGGRGTLHLVWGSVC